MKKLPIIISAVVALAIGVGAGLAIGFASSNTKTKPNSSSEPFFSSESVPSISSSSSSSSESSIPSSSSVPSSSSTTSSLPVVVNYIVSFKNYDGTLLSETVVKEGETATYTGPTPVRAETAECTYTFSGWDQPLENITSDCVRVAQYTETLKPVTNYYKVTFKNYDDTLLQEVNVEEGKNATYTGATPTRTNTPEFTYTFTGWDASLENITADCVRIAQYSATNVEYTVKFYNYDNQLLYTDVVYYQGTATYYGETPTREATSAYYYTFKGWDKELTNVTKSFSTKALYDAHGVSKQITLKPSNGQPDSVLQVTYGEAYDLGTPVNTGFTFLGWFSNETTAIPTSGTWEYTDVSVLTAKWGTGYYEFVENEDGYTVSLTDEGKNVSEIVIPTSFNGKSVTALGENFLRNNTNIEKITIPATIKKIPNYAFYKCTKLSEVELNEGLERIGSYAFDSCKLKVLIIPSTCTVIENSAFEYNSELYHVYLPISVTTVEQYAFYAINASACICIEYDYVPSWGNNWRSGATVYTNCTKLVVGEDYNYVIRNVSGNDSVIILRLSQATSQLESFTFPTAVEGINDIRVGSNLFKSNVNIRSVDLSNVTRIGENAFLSCSNLSNITFSNSLTIIGSYAFRYCTSLTRLEIPTSVTEIQSYGFDGCSNLTYIYLPSSVTTIGSYAFDDCNKSTIYTNAHSASSGWASNWKGGQPIYYDFVSVDATDDFKYVTQSYMGESYVTITGLTATGLNKKNLVIPDQIEGISDIRLINSLFNGLSELVSIDLGIGVTKIPTSCFSNCSKLETVVLHNGVTSIGQSAFLHCSKLTSINMPSTLTTIGRQAFDYCTSLREIVIPISVTTIEAYAFDSMGKIAILIEASVAQPNWKQYWSGSSPANKQFIYDYVSSGVTGDYRYAKTSNGVTDSIYILGLVEGSTSTNLVVPDQIEGISNIKIANYAFDGNTIIKTVDLGNSVTYIGSYAFRNCSSLRQVIIPAGCTVIKAYAFQGCSTECVLNCEVNEKPDAWENNWNISNCQVIWGYTR